MAKILVVDPAERLREITFRILSAEGHTVSGAESLAEALRYLKDEDDDRSPFEVVIVEGTMANVEQFVAKTKAISPAPDVLVTTISKDLSSLVRLKRMGASGYVMKPFDRISLPLDVEARFPVPAQRLALRDEEIATPSFGM